MVGVRSPGTSTGIAGVDVVACDQADVECTVRLDSATTDANGLVNLTLPNGFAGYFEVSSADNPPKVIHSLVYSGAPQYGSGGISWSGIAPAALGVVLSLAPASTAGTATLVLQANGCAGTNRGASFSLDPAGGTAFYTRNGVPVVASATVDETDADGAGGFVGVPVGGGVIATWSVHATGQVIQSRAVALRADSVTYDLNW